MSNEMTVYEANQDIAIYRPPEIVLAEAQKAAKSLAQVVSGKKKPVIMNGEQYLEFEDWQTVGRFYGVTAKVVSTTFIDYGSVQGFEARAVALRADGMEISAAEAMCLNDEDKWSVRAKYAWENGQRKKVGEEKVPLFQLRSMAQTRACAKALRNVLAWVVVLAGYKAIPAEEMTGNEGGQTASKAPITEPQKKSGNGEKKAEPTPTGEKVTAVIENVTAKEGEKNGKKYKLYTITGDGVDYKTFDRTFAERAWEAKIANIHAIITFSKSKFGNDIVNLELDVPDMEMEEAL